MKWKNMFKFNATEWVKRWMTEANVILFNATEWINQE